MPHWPSRFSDYSKRIVPSPIRALAEMQRASDTINFGPGEPDPALFPSAAIQETLARLLADPDSARQVLQYGPSHGEPRLRERIAAHMAAQGVRCGPENILVTNGSQQAMHLVAALLVNPGDTVAVQSPTYPGAIQIFTSRGAVIRSIEELGRNGAAAPALIYAMANFQNPTGATLDRSQRRALLALAEAQDTIVVEDDPYGALRFEGEALPPVMAVNAGTDTRPIDEVPALYLGSFSKSVVPGFRLGWVVAPRAIIEGVALLKQTEDLQAGMLAQACLAELMGPVVDEHAERLRAAYRARRDAMVEALQGAQGNLASWAVPSGGFFLWLTLPDGFDTAAMLPAAAANGVTYVPGRAFYHAGGGANRLRLSFSATPPERMAEGIARLFKTIREAR